VIRRVVGVAILDSSLHVEALGVKAGVQSEGLSSVSEALKKPGTSSLSVEAASLTMPGISGSESDMPPVGGCVCVWWWGAVKLYINEMSNESTSE
jgi:hypothetical protein